LEAELAESRKKLLVVRDKRVRPGTDDKVLASWNGLMIDSMARAGSVLDEANFIEAAIRAAEFILQSMRRKDGRLLHTWRRGQAKLDAYLDDYAYLANAFVSLYEATFNEQWIDEAVRLADEMIAHFSDPSGGGFFFTADDHEELLVRPKDLQDSSTPSGNSMAATALARLGALCQRSDYIDAARRAAGAASDLLARSAAAAGQMLIAIDLLAGPTFEVVLAGNSSTKDFTAAVVELRSRYLPRVVVAHRGKGADKSSALDGLFEGKEAVGNEVTLYVCREYACQAPVSGVGAMKERLAQLELDHQSRRM
jgi:uncharacterized protein YyaL (SSP411 family)